MIDTAPRARVAHIMGTAVSVHIVGRLDDATLRDASRACFEDLRHADRVFSPFREDSELQRIARREMRLADADPSFALIADACEDAAARTGGLFCANYRGAYDPSGYVKGWAVERAARTHLAPLLEKPGVLAAGINAGGDMQLLTAPDALWTWNVAVVDPADRARIVAHIPVRNGAVATSGTAERGRHVIDPRTGRAAVHLASATVVASCLAEADVWATAAVVAGFDDLAWISRAPETAGIVIAPDGRVRRWLDGMEVQVSRVAATAT